MNAEWRVEANHVYQGYRVVATFFNPADARACVEAHNAAGWRDIASAPRGEKVLVRCGPTVDVAYQTDHQSEIVDTWRHGGSAERWRQLDYWPKEWRPLL